MLEDIVEETKSPDNNLVSLVGQTGSSAKGTSNGH